MIAARPLARRTAISQTRGRAVIAKTGGLYRPDKHFIVVYVECIHGKVVIGPHREGEGRAGE